MATPSRAEDDTIADATGPATVHARSRSAATVTVADHLHAGDPPLSVGTTLDRFEILGLLGEGGMGRVYRAHDPRLRRDVALKVLRGKADGEGVARLLREARAMARLSHPNLLPIFDVGRHAEGSGQDGPREPKASDLDRDRKSSLFIAMELVEGQTLAQWLRAAPRSPAEVLAVLVAAGRGLAAAHAAGLVHRDFKPSNVMLGHDGRVRVMDFGLARLSGDASASDASASDAYSQPSFSSSSIDETLTRSDVVAGSPPYMAPEQHRGEPPDARCDQFAFCVVLWEALAGTRPFASQDYSQLVNAKHRGPPEPRGEPRIPASLHEPLRRGLAVDPAARFPSMDALLHVLEPRPGRVQRRRVITAAGLALLGGGAALGLLGPWGEPPCRSARTRLAGTWDAPMRARVEAAVLATGVPHAEDTWQRLAPRLDDYAARWIHDHTDACEATHVRHEQSEAVMDARMRCLDGHRRELVALVQALEATDAATVERAVQAAEGLPRLGRCADVEWVAHEAPLPDDPEVRREVEALREELARAAALQAASRVDEALALATSVRERSEALGWEPLVAEAVQRVGKLEGEAGRHDRAVEALTRAYFTAEHCEHHVAQAQSAIELVYVVGRQQQQHEDALQWAKHAEVVVERIDDDELRAELLANTAGVLESQARHEEALELSRQALELRRGLLGPEHIHVAYVLNNVAIVEYSLGRYDAALASFSQAYAIQERALGPRHPQTVQSYGNVGAVYEALGRYAEALEHYRRSLANYEEMFGPEHPTVALLLNNIGLVLEAQGELDSALEHYQRALAIREKVLDPQHPDIATSIDSSAGVLQSQGRLEQAEALQRRALAIREAALGPEHPVTAISLNNLGGTLFEQGRLAEAGQLHRRALAIREQALGPRHPSFASSLNNLGLVLAREGSHDDALRSFRRALAILEATVEPEHPKLAEILTNIADSLTAKGQPEAAIEPLERALRIREHEGVAPRLRAKARFALARGLAAAGREPERARALAQEARREHQAEGDRAEALAEIDAWLRDPGTK